MSLSITERKRLHVDLKNALNEALKKRKRNIYTIDATDIEDEYSIEDMQYTGSFYYSEDDAIEAARQMTEEYKDSEHCICVSVYAGLEELFNGEVQGEPYDIYTISNKSKEETAEARQNAGYVALEVDEYIF